MLEIDSDSIKENLDIYHISDSIKEKRVISEECENIYLSDNTSGTLRNIILTPDEAIRVELNVVLYNTNRKQKMSNLKSLLTIRYCNLYAEDKVLVSAEQQIENKIEEYISIAQQFDSPIFFGEYCINEKYINEYYKYQDYAIVFNKLCNKYGINRIWHRMTEYPADNGYGCYINSKIASEKGKRESMWELVMPMFLDLK